MSITVDGKQYDTAEIGRNLRAANMAKDEATIRRIGYIAAIVKAPSVEAVTRRAALTLGQHHQDRPFVAPGEVADLLELWARIQDAQR